MKHVSSFFLNSVLVFFVPILGFDDTIAFQEIDCSFTQLLSIMALWCEKYRPKSFAELDYNLEQVNILKKVLGNANFPHLAFFGVSGSGKMTRVKALLNELFDLSATNTRMETKTFELASDRKIEQRFVTSNFHIEVNPSENGFHDRVVIQELIKEVATCESLSKKHPFKVVVILEADRLTREAQQALRRTLEKYVTTCRVILVGERSSRLIPAIKSRFLFIRNPAPTEQEIRSILMKISDIERFGSSKNKNFTSALDTIIAQSDRNLRRAILMLQAFACSQETGRSNAMLSFKWIALIETLAHKLGDSQTAKKMTEVRATLNQLMKHLIPPEVILRLLTMKLVSKCLDDDARGKLIRIAAQIDHRIALGSRPIIHLELFIFQYMSLFRSSLENFAADLDETMDV